LNIVTVFDTKNGNYVQIVNKRNTERLVKLLDSEKVYLGGDYDIEKRLIQPTILDNIHFEDSIMEEEIFGPILPIISYDNLDGAIAKVKGLPKPLSCYVFTKSKSSKNKILNEISFGGGCVNEAVMHLSNPNFGFGGVGDSGMGSYHGEEGFKAFSHFKSILDKPTWIEPNIKYYPHTPLKLKLLKFFFRLN